MKMIPPPPQQQKCHIYNSHHTRQQRRQRQYHRLFTTTTIITLITTISPYPTSSMIVNNYPSSPSSPHIIIVGGGVGGLALASRLTTTTPSPRITLYEKNDMVGGRCGSFHVGQKNSFRHENGPSLLLLKEEYEALFREVGGGDARSYGLDMVRCVPAYRAIFDDGDYIDLGYPSTSSSSSLSSPGATQTRDKMNSYEHDGFLKWEEYMTAMSAFLDCGLPNFIEERLDLGTLPEFMVQALRGGGKAWPLKPHSDVVDAFFSSDKMRALASFQDLYVGLEPYRNDKSIAGGVLTTTAPAVFGLLSALELHPTNRKSGVYAPIGGFRSVARAFERLAKDCGVTIQCQTTVTSVTNNGVYISDNNDNNNSATTTTAKQPATQFIPADLIIINADLPYAIPSLLQPPPSSNDDNDTPSERYDWIDSFNYSSGVIAFHWSLNKPIPNLQTHNVFLSSSSPKQRVASWSVLRRSSDDNANDDAFNFYLHHPTTTDPTAAPEGCDVITILVPCEGLEYNESYRQLSREEVMRLYKEQFPKERIDEVRRRVLRRLQCVVEQEESDGFEWERCIVNEVVEGPGDYAEKYNVGKGVPFGLSHGLGQLSLTRPGADYFQSSTSFDNVLFVGASSRPGNGVPLVLIGAKLVAKKVMSLLQKKGVTTTK